MVAAVLAGDCVVGKKRAVAPESKPVRLSVRLAECLDQIARIQRTSIVKAADDLLLPLVEQLYARLLDENYRREKQRLQNK